MTIAALVQHLVWIIFQPIIHILFGYRVINTTKTPPAQITGPAILVSNHRSHLDHFFVTGCFPFRSEIWPIRFLVFAKFFEMPVIGLILRIGGCISVVRPTPGRTTIADVLAPADQELSGKTLLLIFPEGRIVHQAKPTKGGRGAAYLAMKTGVPIRPFFIEGNDNFSWKNVLLGKVHVTLFIGSPYYLKGHFDNQAELLAGTSRIIDSIGALAP